MEQVNSLENGKVIVSYLVASYNHENYILDCLNSIKSDFIPNSEIIIIDDGSSDSSVEKIKGWIRQNSEISAQLISRSNQGISATLNQLFSLATGEFYRTVSSDDVIIPASTQSLMDVLNKNKNLLVAFGDVETIDEAGVVKAASHMTELKNSLRIYEADLKRAIISKWAVCGPCWLLRKNFHKQIGSFDESLIIEDWNMYLRLVSKDLIIFVNKIVAGYRVHGANTSMTRDISKRIKNLNSQVSAGEKNLANFSGAYKILLQSEIFLLKAKVQYLSRFYLKTVFIMSAHLILKWTALIEIYFRKAIA